MNVRKITVACLALLLGLGLAIGPATAEELNLQQCIDLAMQNSLDLKKAETDVEIARQRIKEAEAKLYFSVDTTYSYAHIWPRPETTAGGRTVQTAPQDYFEWEITLTQPVFAGFALINNKKLKELGLDAAQLALPLSRLDLALAVKQAYFQVLLAQKGQLVAEQAVKQLEAQVDTAKSFYEVGMIPHNDLLQVEVELANARQSLLQAINGVRLAKAALNVRMRRDIEAALEIVDVEQYEPAQPGYQESLSRALEQRPEIKQAAKSVEMNELSVELAKADYWPTVAFSASYDRTGDTPIVNGSDFDDDPWSATLALGVSWNVFSWGQRSYNVGAVKGGVIKARHVLTQIKEAIGLEVKQAQLNVLEALESIPVAKKAIEQAQENFRMSQERYKEQVTTSTEVLDAQTLLTRAQRNYYAALYGYHLAMAGLKRAEGEL